MKSDGFQDKAHPYRASLFGKNKTEISFDIQFCQTPPKKALLGCHYSSVPVQVPGTALGNTNRNRVLEYQVLQNRTRAKVVLRSTIYIVSCESRKVNQLHVKPNRSQS